MTVYVEILRQSEQQALVDLARVPVPDGEAGLKAATFIPVDEDLLVALGGTRAGFAEYWIRADWVRASPVGPWTRTGTRGIFGAAATTEREPVQQREFLGLLDIKEDDV